MYKKYIQQDIRIITVTASASQVGYGESATLSLNINDADSYRWYRAASAAAAGTLLGTTSSNSFTATGITSDGYYYCTAVKNNRGELTSNRVPIGVVLGAGQIAAAQSKAPVNASVTINNAGAGSPGLSYSWQMRQYSPSGWTPWTVIPGQTSLSLAYNLTTDSEFKRIATNGVQTVESNTAYVEIDVPPVNTSVPANGGSVPLGFAQAQIVSITPAEAGVYVSGSNLVFPPLWTATDRTYTASLSVPVSKNRIAITVTQAKRTVTLTASALSGGYGGSCTLSVNETSADSYHWYKRVSGTASLMATTSVPSYTVTGIVSDAEYYCTAVKNNAGSITSNTVTVEAAFDPGAIDYSARITDIGATITINSSRPANKPGATYSWERSFKDPEDGHWSPWQAFSYPNQTETTLTTKITSDTRYRRKAVYNGTVLYSNTVEVEVNVQTISAQGGTFSLGPDARDLDEIRPSNEWVTYSNGVITFGPSWTEQDVTYLFKVLYAGSSDHQFVYIKQSGRSATLTASPTSVAYKQNAVLSVDIPDGATYQWYKQTAPEAAPVLLYTGTTSSYTLTSLTDDAWYYCKAIKSPMGELTSNTVSVTVALGAGQISAAQAQVPRNGTAVINNLESANKPSAAYSWEMVQRAGGTWGTAWTPLDGQTGATLNYPITADTKFRRKASFSGSAAVTSEAIVLMTIPEASFTLGPDGGNYELPYSGCSIRSVTPDRPDISVSGTSLVIPPSWTPDARTYSIVLNVPVAELGMTFNLTQQARTITLTASQLSGGYGGSCTLSVNEASADSYQWYKRVSGTASLMATTSVPSYTVTGIVSDAEYYCTAVKNNAGSITTNTVTVEAVFDPGTISAVPQAEMGNEITVNNTRGANKTGATYAWEVSAREENDSWTTWNTLPGQSGPELTYKLEADTRFRRKTTWNNSALYSNEVTVTAHVMEISAEGGEFNLGGDALGIDEMRPHRPDVTCSGGTLVFPPSWSENDIVYLFKVVVSGSASHRFVYLKQKGRTAAVVNPPAKAQYNTDVTLSVNIEQGDAYRWYQKTEGGQWSLMEVPNNKTVHVTMYNDLSFYCKIIKNDIGELTTEPVLIPVDLYGGRIAVAETEVEKGALATVNNETASNKTGVQYGWETASSKSM